MLALLMDEAAAAALAAATAAHENRLEPRAVAAGPWAGRFALPARVIDDDAFAGQRAALMLLERVALDPAEAWPVAANGGMI